MDPRKVVMRLLSFRNHGRHDATIELTRLEADALCRLLTATAPKTPSGEDIDVTSMDAICSKIAQEVAQ